MRYLTLTLAFLLQGACGEGDVLRPTRDGAPPDMDGTGAEPDAGAAVDAPRRVLLLGSCPDGVETMPDFSPPAQTLLDRWIRSAVDVPSVIATQQDYERLANVFAPEPLPTVDFSSELVLAAYQWGTCSLQDIRFRVVDRGGAPHLDISVSDRNALCGWICTSVEGQVIAVKVSFADPSRASVCVRVHQACE